MKKVLLRGATVITMDSPTFVGDVLMEDGKIAALGENLSTGGAEVYELSGMFVMPGLVDAHSHVGLSHSGTRDKDHNERTHPIQPHMRTIDGIDPTDVAFEEARSGGVTTSVVCPGSVNLLGGVCSAIKSRGSTVEKMLLRDGIAMKAALGENPKFCEPANKAYPVSRMGIAAKIRETIVGAQNYKRQLEIAEKTGGFVPRDLAKEAMIPVIERKMPLKIHCHTHSDIITAIRICNEFDLRYTLDHCTEGGFVAGELVEAEKKNCEGVIIGPFGIYKGKLEAARRPGYEFGRTLYDAGVKFAIMTDFFETQPERLITQAALNAAEGLPDEEALKAVTIHAAEICGIADRVGSLTVGKDADVAVFSHYPLESKARCMLTFIDGELVYKR